MSLAVDMNPNCSNKVRQLLSSLYLYFKMEDSRSILDSTKLHIVTVECGTVHIYESTREELLRDGLVTLRQMEKKKKDCLIQIYKMSAHQLHRE